MVSSDIAIHLPFVDIEDLEPTASPCLDKLILNLDKRSQFFHALERIINI